MLAYEDAKRPKIANAICTTCGHALRFHWVTGNGAKKRSLLIVKGCAPKCDKHCQQFTNPNLDFITAEGIPKPLPRREFVKSLDL